MSTHDLTIAAVQAAPPVAVSAWITLVSSDLDLWIKGLTILYIILQIAWVILKITRKPIKVDNE